MSAVLTAIAAECGYDATVVADYLASDRDADTVREKESASRQKGITMVPTFVLNGQKVIVGAEDPAILVEGIRSVLQAG